MKLIIEQSLEHNEVEITIKCGLIDDKLQKLISQIRLYSFSITGKREGVSCILHLEDIYYFESIDDHTFVYCNKDVYECDFKLYELEEKLTNTNFTRVSKSCILNIAHVVNVRSLLNGKLEAQLCNEEKVVISRHYIRLFKEKLGM